MIRRLAFALVLCLGLATASARSDRLVVYAPAKVFPTAVRFLRLDVGAKIVEKDGEAGYVVFELTDGDKVHQGSLELVAADSAGRPAAKIVINIDGQPSYVEAVMLDKLEAKLRAELGDPPSPPPSKDRGKDPPPPAAPAPAPPSASP